MIDEASFEFQGEMAFGAADEDGLQQFAERLVGDLGADPEAGDLLLVLDHPELLDGAAEVRQAQPGGDRADGAVPGHGEVVLLHGEGVGALGRGEVGGRDGRVASAGSGQGLDAQGLVGALLRGAVGGRAGTHQEVLGLAQQQDGALRGGAREIAHVGGAGDQRRRAAARVAVFPQTRPAGRVHL